MCCDTPLRTSIPPKMPFSAYAMSTSASMAGARPPPARTRRRASVAGSRVASLVAVGAPNRPTTTQATRSSLADPASEGGVASGRGGVRRARRRHRRGPLGLPSRGPLPRGRPGERRVPPQRARPRRHGHLARGRRRARARGPAQAPRTRPRHRRHPDRHRRHPHRLRRRHHGERHALVRHRPALGVGRHGSHRRSRRRARAPSSSTDPSRSATRDPARPSPPPRTPPPNASSTSTSGSRSSTRSSAWSTRADAGS